MWHIECTTSTSNPTTAIKIFTNYLEFQKYLINIHISILILKINLSILSKKLELKTIKKNTHTHTLI